MQFEARIEGVAFAQGQFKELTRSQRRAALSATFNKAGTVIQKEAAVLVPVDEGDLKRAIAKSVSSKTTSVRVDVGVKRNAKGGPARYGHIVETGSAHTAPHPFLRPALDNKGKAAVEVVAKQLGSDIDRVTRKAAAKRVVS